MKVKLNDVRIAFCQSIWPGTAEQYQGKGVARHSATFLIVPGSENDKAIEAAIKAVAAEKWPKKAAALLESMRGNSNKFCYQKGDLKDYDGFEGMMSLAGHRKESDGAPEIFGQFRNPDGKLVRLTQKDGKIYAGCYVNASVDIYAQDGENQGIRCGLLGIQFNRDGDSFGGAGRAKEEDFESIEAPEEAEDLA
jgi:hypothetical protein